MTLRCVLLLTLMVSALVAGAAAAQNPTPPTAPADDVDLDPNLSQPDFTIVNLPTTVRLPRFKSAFRVTHRFTRPLGQGDFGDLTEDLSGSMAAR